MNTPHEYKTDRLILRQWHWADLDPFAEMNADAEVMRYFSSVGTREGARASIETWMREIDGRGWSNWAVELAETRDFIGFVGITIPKRQLPFYPLCRDWMAPS